jgi:tetraacyldisaccharide 4'-kinase
MPLVSRRSWIEAVWFGNGPVPMLGRALLLPFSALYAGIVEIRRIIYARGILTVRRSRIPVLSVGNLSVGGTGKTPFAAWIARRLEQRGAKPAIVLRGYGDDEPAVHARLNPSILVVVSPDRAQGIEQAVAAGASTAVLDDAFQHISAGRDVDIVLISVERWSERRYLLPAGPWREGVGALHRASLIVVTRKAASQASSRELTEWLRSQVPGVPVIAIALSMDRLVPVGGGASVGLSTIARERLLAFSGIADPATFFAQLQQAGAEVTGKRFSDHHAFTKEEVAALAAAGRDVDRVVCTLKDAVKAAPMWPDEGVSLWYVLQALNIEEGEEKLDEVLDMLVRPRPAADGSATGAITSTTDPTGHIPRSHTYGH